MKGFVLGGTASGVGKTVATLAVLRALEDAGHDPQPAKAGPDFIDPSHHEPVAGKPSRSLDPWLEGDHGTRRNYYRGDGDVCVVEGMMGLYDGSVASTARVASVLDLPVVLVVDASAGMQSVAATALGFREYAAQSGHDVDVVGVLAQRAHGGRHEAGIRDALPDGLAYLGRIPPSDDLEIPDRHLGLQMGEEAAVDPDALAAAAEHVDAERLVDVAREPPRPAPGESRPETGKRVAVAEDAAFCFAYPATRERLRARADVTTFSPVAGDDLPDCDGVYLPGGYPELHADALSAAPALDTLADRAADGLPVLGECGGLLALAECLTTTDGDTVEMAGVLPADVRMCDRYQALDHVELRARGDGALTASAGETLRGHEFHYSEADVADDARFAFDVERGDGITGDRDGLVEHRTLGTYAHVHAESGAFDHFLDSL
ncbi:cobyrinic acid a,c-diamide synthase [Halobacterium rubrum]|uniref:cobyrinic acid a,c-diamide synthase n=1 Tax=Halobacterium TaxID=2239 RepID=UPI001F23414B|nr:cobyrinic acid a,c-diamide synthase [Halobacterium rubrum]MDH5019648.1 cobyrinic acid a,c-diamide synthase [Halobacterium rubrum]